MSQTSKLPLFSLSLEQEKKRWIDLDKLIFRKGPFCHEMFTPGNETKDFLQNHCKVLIIGAGGLGCLIIFQNNFLGDLVKNLAMSGFRNIDIIDMDYIDLSNLNRQFLFREKDVKKSKSETAAAFINKRVPGAKVVAHNCKIQDKPLEFYEQFNIVISGLDSISARRWINSTLIDMVEYVDDDCTEPDMSSIKLFIDGGTEGFKGQARVITPTKSSCFECTMDLFPPQTTYPRCTIASSPRLPEHCIMYGLEVLWDKTKNKSAVIKESEKSEKLINIPDDEKFDGDNVAHVTWVFKKAQERAQENNIRGVTYRLTQGVVKNIIPAIASTNAVVASVCANECLKLATLMATQMEDYMMYNGNEGIYTYTYKTDKKDGCYTCGTPPAIEIKSSPVETLGDLLEKIREHPDIRFSNPAIAYSTGGILYNTKLKSLEKKSLDKVGKTLKELGIEDETEFDVVDTMVKSDGGFCIRIVFADKK